MAKKVTSIYLEEELHEYASKLATEITRDPDLPDFSKTRVLRELMQIGALALIDDDPADLVGDLEIAADGGALSLPRIDAADLVPTREIVKFQRQQVKEENYVADLRGGFEGRVKDEFLKRFSNGYRPDDMADLAHGYIREARVLWPEDDQRRREAEEYVERHLASYRENFAKGEDVLDVDAAYGSFSGVEEAVKWDGVDEDLFLEMALDARDHWRSYNHSGEKPDLAAITRRIKNAYGVPTEVAKAAREAGIAVIRRGIEDPEKALREAMQGDAPSIEETNENATLEPRNHDER